MAMTMAIVKRLFVIQTVHEDDRIFRHFGLLPNLQRCTALNPLVYYSTID